MHSLSSRKAFMRFLSSILSGWWERSYVHWSQVHTCLVHVIKSQNITSYQLLVFWRSVRLDKKIEAVHVHVQCTTLAHVSFFSRFVLFVPGGRCSYSSNTQNQIPYYHAHINHCFSRSSLFIFYVIYNFFCSTHRLSCLRLRCLHGQCFLDERWLWDFHLTPIVTYWVTTRVVRACACAWTVSHIILMYVDAYRFRSSPVYLTNRGIMFLMRSLLRIVGVNRCSTEFLNLKFFFIVSSGTFLSNPPPEWSTA